MPDKELYKDIMTYVLSDSQHSDLLQIDELIYPDIDAKDIDAFIKGNAALLERSVLQGLQKRRLYCTVDAEKIWIKDRSMGA